MRVADDHDANKSLSEEISQTAEYCQHLYLQSFLQPAAIVFGRFESDQVGPGHWWGFCEIRLPRGQGRAWIRYFAGPMRDLSRFPLQTSSGGHDPDLTNTRNEDACSRDAAADRCRYGNRPIYRAVPQPRIIVVSIDEIAAGATLREHKHPFARYAYVLTGTLRVTDTETGHTNVYEAGDFIIEAMGQWHQAVNLDDRPLKLLVIDQQADQKSYVVMRK